MLRLAVEAAEGGKLDMGALMKQAMASPAIAPYKKDAPKYAQKLAKAAHSLRAAGSGFLIKSQAIIPLFYYPKI
jgi:hypothetical protein